MANTERGCLRPWIAEKLRRGDPLIQWVDRDASKFKIKWKRLGKPDTRPEDFNLFRDWAIHKGRYEPATQNADPEKWKATLRNALNKSKEFKELLGETHNSGKNHYRVYRFVRPLEDRGTVSDNTVVRTPRHATMAHTVATPGGLPIPEAFADNHDNVEVPEISSKAQQEGSYFLQANGVLQGPDYRPASLQGNNNSDQGNNVDARMQLWFKYCGKNVHTMVINSGSRLSYGKREALPGSGSEWLNLEAEPTFGNSSFTEVNFPEFLIPSNASHSNIPQERLKKWERGPVILHHAYRGIELQIRNDNIFARRLCKASVHFVSQKTEGKPVKIERMKKGDDDYVEIFDFKYFLGKLSEYSQNTTNDRQLPHPLVYLGVGEMFHADMCVNVPLASCKALQIMNEKIPDYTLQFVENFACGSIGQLISKTDTLDDNAEMTRGMLECCSLLEDADYDDLLESLPVA